MCRQKSWDLLTWHFLDIEIDNHSDKYNLTVVSIDIDINLASHI